MADELLTVAEAARIMGTDRTRIHAMMNDGRLTALKEPTRGKERPYRYRLLRSEVERLSGEGWRKRRRAEGAGDAER